MIGLAAAGLGAGLPTLLHGLWNAVSAPAYLRFRRALREPERAQLRLLRAAVEANQGTAFGIEHGFARVRDIASFRRRVPAAGYERFAPYVDRIRAGEPQVLTAEPVERLVPSSGSASARKHLPSTRGLRAQMARAIAAWTFDLYARTPQLRGGPAYWSISPLLPVDPTPSRVQIGFADDAAYLGALLAPLVSQTLAVSSAVRELGDVQEFRYATLLALLRARGLRLISVWHPSFFPLIVDERERAWDTLLADIAAGTVHLPRASAQTRRALLRGVRPMPERARELAELGPRACSEAYWPALRVLSAWGDGASQGPFARLHSLFPRATLQAKGLVASEGFVSLPFAGTYPLAIDSHLLEFVDDRGRCWLAHELREGGEYEVLLTTAGGLYRYRLGDRVIVEGRLEATPCVRFVGRADARVDLVGEKLDDAFASRVLRALFTGSEPAFALLAPDSTGARPAYCLFVEAPAGRLSGLRPRLEAALSDNPYFAHARRFEQLGPTRVFAIANGGQRAYLARMAARGQGLGDIKPAALSGLDDWSATFVGQYLRDPHPVSSEESVS